MHWKMADCSLSTGIISPPKRRFVSSTSCLPQTMLSLFARATRLPCSSAASSGASAANPLTPLTTTSASALAARTVLAPSPNIVSVPLGSSKGSNGVSLATTCGRYRFACLISDVISLRADKPKSVISSVCEEMTSSVCLPMEPVLPSTVIIFVMSVA
ncbi:hypothetical protein SDC9_88326 [bioreactor metagenome]|uniref:Uncharacterized protein n=1 Tax=bioreactor metagenome TaxID=1076179 RepID=A0A644ZLA4_9ZZZZ